MDSRFRKVAVFVGAAALAGGVGVGVAAQGNDTASSQAAMPQRAGAPGGPGGMDVSALAQKLGVSTAKLQAALEAARPSGDPRDGHGGADALAAAIAKQLGLPTAKVQEALEASRPRDAFGGAPPPGDTGMPDGSTPPAASGSSSDATPA